MNASTRTIAKAATMSHQWSRVSRKHVKTSRKLPPLHKTIIKSEKKFKWFIYQWGLDNWEREGQYEGRNINASWRQKKMRKKKRQGVGNEKYLCAFSVLRIQKMMRWLLILRLQNVSSRFSLKNDMIYCRFTVFQQKQNKIIQLFFFWVCNRSIHQHM